MVDSLDKQASSAYTKGKYKEALPLLSELAKQDNVAVLLAVAWINETGAAGEKNTKDAINYYRRAADLGSCDALYRLGRIFEKSNDFGDTFKVFEQGALQEHLPCISALGLLMLRLSNNPEEIKIGMHWLNYAADRGHIFARKQIICRKYKNTNSFRDVLWMFFRLTLLQFEYFIEKMKDKHSVKIL